MNDYDPNGASYQEAYRRASRRVELKLQVVRRIVSYVSVSVILLAVYIFTDWGNGFNFNWSNGLPWFMWPVGILGVLLVVDLLKLVLSENGTLDRDAMMAEEMRKMGANSYPPYNQTHQ
jgi:hypothetical protein